MPRRVPQRRGVTLIEVLIVIAIMSMLASAVAVAVLGIHRDAQRDAAAIDAASLRTLASAWRSRHPNDECPTTARLVADRMLDRGSKAHDPWGTPYVISCSEDEVTVLSAGPDRRQGTADDIVAPPDSRLAGGR
jgi:general secretion pathway protein G